MPASISKVFPAILLNQASGRTIEVGDHLATSLNIAIYGFRVRKPYRRTLDSSKDIYCAAFTYYTIIHYNRADLWNNGAAVYKFSLPIWRSGRYGDNK